MKYDVFISYSSHDQKVVEGLCAYLEQYKIRCFVAYRDIPKGKPWPPYIPEALNQCRMMVVVFSCNFNRSEEVDRELTIASKKKKPILTFRLSDEEFKGTKEYYLSNINWIDAFPNPEAVFGQVLDNVKALLGVKHSAPQATTVVKPSVTYKTYQVGDYYDDGKRQGVVFEVSDDGRHGKIVSLDQVEEQWCSDKQYIMRIVVGASSYNDGKSNTDKVIARADSEEYHAFQWCRAKGDEWYLPSKEELMLLRQVRDKVNKTLIDKSMEELGHIWYWSSTETDEFCAWSVNMYNGYPSSSYKYNDLSVRAVSAF